MGKRGGGNYGKRNFGREVDASLGWGQTVDHSWEILNQGWSKFWGGKGGKKRKRGGTNVGW